VGRYESGEHAFVLARTTTYATIFIGFILVFLPARLLSWSGATTPPSIGVAQGMGMLVAGIGATLALWCVFTFPVVGQ
jgi:hypothetical protein